MLLKYVLAISARAYGIKMWFFKRKHTETHQDGLSAETAFKMPEIGSASAISIEYKTLAKLFGREGSDWRIHDRIRSKTATGRQIEKFILGTREGRKVVYFDITDVLKSTDPEPVQEIVDAVLKRQQSRMLTIELPNNTFLMLYKIMDDVGNEVTTEKFDAEHINSKIMQTVASHDINTSEKLPLTLSVADWVSILSVTRIINVQSLQAEELVNDLRAYIEGSIKKAGPE